MVTRSGLRNPSVGLRLERVEHVAAKIEVELFRVLARPSYFNADGFFCTSGARCQRDDAIRRAASVAETTACCINC